MSKAHQLAEKLKKYIPNGDGYNSEFANDLAEAVEYLSQDEQEPVAWLITHHENPPLYARPPKRQPLSTEQIRDLLRQADTGLYFAKLIEKSHGIGE